MNRTCRSSRELWGRLEVLLFLSFTFDLSSCFSAFDLHHAGLSFNLHHTCNARHAVVIDGEQHVIPRWCQVRIVRRGHTERSPGPSEFKIDQALPEVKSVRDRTEFDQIDLVDPAVARDVQVEVYNEFREDVLSHHIPCGNLTKRPEVSKLLQKLDTIPIGAALKIGFLRSLMRARYAVEPLGHYGLAKAKYTHFTSPIRRYADLVVHRALFAGSAPAPGAVFRALAENPGATKSSESSHQRHTHEAGREARPATLGACVLPKSHSLKETAEHISDTERNSADAERDSKDVKMYAFLKAQLAMAKPPVYPALVIDVRNFGFFVDVPGLAMSGLIHCSSLTDDFYEFDEARGQLTGRRNRRVFRLGDKVEVQIAKVDSFKKQVDFRLAREERKAPDDRSRPPQPKDRDRSPVAAGEPRGSRPQFRKPHDGRSAADGDRPRSEQKPQRPFEQRHPKQRPPQRFQDRQQPRPQSRPQPGQQSRGPSRPPQQKSGQFKTQSQSRPPLPSRPSRDAKSQPARPQSGGGNFRAGPARPQIPSSHSRSKFGGRRRR